MTPREPYRSHEIAELSERFQVKRVIDPSTLAAIGEKTGVLQSLEMEREARLAGLERTGQVAYALFAIGQLVKDAKASLIGQGGTDGRFASRLVPSPIRSRTGLLDRATSARRR